MAGFIVQMTEQEMADAISFACKTCNVPELAKQIKVEYNDRLRTTGGLAYPNQNRIELSTELFSQFTKDGQREVLIHEACHLIAFHKTGKGGHDKTWKACMVACGLPPNRCYKPSMLRNPPIRPVMLADSTFACTCRKGVRISEYKQTLAANGKGTLVCAFCSQPFRKE